MTTQSNAAAAVPDTAAAAGADTAAETSAAAAAATANTAAAATDPAATDPAADAEEESDDSDSYTALPRPTPTALILFPQSVAHTTDTAAASTLASMATDRDDQQNQFQVIQEVANPRDGVSPMVTQAASPPRSNGIDAASPPDDSLLLLPLADYTSSDSVFCPFYYRLQAEIIKYGYHFSCTMAVLEVVQSILNLCNIGSTADRVIHIPFLPSMTFGPLLRTNFHLYQGENLKQKSKPTSGGGTVGGGGGGDDDDPKDGDDGNDDDDDDDDDDDQPEWEVNDKDVPQVGEAYPSPDIMDQDIEDNYESYKAVVQATQHQKETYTKLTLALKSVSLLCHVYEKYIPLVRNHHLKLRQEAMTIESVITAHGRGEMTDVQVSTITPLVAPSFVCLYGSLNSHSFS